MLFFWLAAISSQQRIEVISIKWPEESEHTSCDGEAVLHDLLDDFAHC